MITERNSFGSVALPDKSDVLVVGGKYYVSTVSSFSEIHVLDLDTGRCIYGPVMRS